MSKYHMSRPERQIIDEGKIREILTKGKFAVIAMCNDNEPYLVTLSYGYDQAKKVLYFHTGLVGQKIDFINKNPNICATIIDDGGYIPNECEHEYCTVVLRGKLHIVDLPEEKRHGMEVLIKHLEENPDPTIKKLVESNPTYEKTAVLRLDIDDLTCKKGR